VEAALLCAPAQDFNRQEAETAKDSADVFLAPLAVRRLYLGGSFSALATAALL
jgi:hypothetical protein